MSNYPNGCIPLEALTPVLLHINKAHKTSAGIRITGI